MGYFPNRLGNVYIPHRHTGIRSIFIYIYDIKKRVSNLINPCRPIAYAVYDCTGYLHQRPITRAEGHNPCRLDHFQMDLFFPSWNYSFPAGKTSSSTPTHTNITTTYTHQNSITLQPHSSKLKDAAY
jgi:hypothetical protein